MGDGPPGFRRNFSCSAVLRIHTGGHTFSITGLLPSMADLSRSIRLKYNFVTPCGVSYNPRKQAFWFGLIPFRSPLLGKSHLLSLPLGTEMFQFPRSATFILSIQINVLFHYKTVGCPIRKSPDRSLLTTPRGISELVPSFIGS